MNVLPAVISARLSWSNDFAGDLRSGPDLPNQTSAIAPAERSMHPLFSWSADMRVTQATLGQLAGKHPASARFQ